MWEYGGQAGVVLVALEVMEMCEEEDSSNGQWEHKQQVEEEIERERELAVRQ